MALVHLQAEFGDPFIEPALTNARLRAQQRGDFGDIEEMVLQAIAQALAQCASQHALVEFGMKGQQRAAADELHEIQQRLSRFHTPGHCAGRDAMDQRAGAGLMVGAVQGAFELFGEIDGAVVDHHRADGQHLITAHVQPGGFQVEDDEALLVQRTFVEQRRGAQGLAALQLLLGQGRTAAGEPGELAHN